MAESGSSKRRCYSQPIGQPSIVGMAGSSSGLLDVVRLESKYLNLEKRLEGLTTPPVEEAFFYAVQTPAKFVVRQTLFERTLYVGNELP